VSIYQAPDMDWRRNLWMVDDEHDPPMGVRPVYDPECDECNAPLVPDLTTGTWSCPNEETHGDE
jgi:hypothetical protein